MITIMSLDFPTGLSITYEMLFIGHICIIPIITPIREKFTLQGIEKYLDIFLEKFF